VFEFIVSAEFKSHVFIAHNDDRETINACFGVAP